MVQQKGFSFRPLAVVFGIVAVTSSLQTVLAMRSMFRMIKPVSNRRRLNTVCKTGLYVREEATNPSVTDVGIWTGYKVAGIKCGKNDTLKLADGLGANGHDLTLTKGRYIIMPQLNKESLKGRSISCWNLGSRRPSGSILRNRPGTVELGRYGMPAPGYYSEKGTSTTRWLTDVEFVIGDSEAERWKEIFDVTLRLSGSSSDNASSSMKLHRIKYTGGGQFELDFGLSDGHGQRALMHQFKGCKFEPSSKSQNEVAAAKIEFDRKLEIATSNPITSQNEVAAADGTSSRTIPKKTVSWRDVIYRQ